MKNDVVLIAGFKAIRATSMRLFHQILRCLQGKQCTNQNLQQEPSMWRGLNYYMGQQVETEKDSFLYVPSRLDTIYIQYVIQKRQALILLCPSSAKKVDRQSLIRFLKKNLNASRPSEHATQGGKCQNAY